MYASLHHSTGPSDLPLTANYPGTGVCCTCYWHGYTLKSLYYYTHTPQQQKDKLDHAIKQIVTLFNQLLEEALKARKIYKNALKMSLKETPLKESEVIKIRNFLTDFATTTFEFWELYTDPSQQHVTLPLQTFITSHTFMGNTSAYWKLKNVQYLIDLEGHTEMDLPVKALFTLASSSDLSEAEEVQLKRWIKCLNKRPVSSSMFGSVLQEVVKIIRSCQQTLVTSAQLSVKLEQFNPPCQLLNARDETHLVWRAKHIKQGLSLVSDDKTFVIGSKLSRDKKTRDHYWIYELSNEPSRVLKTGVNTLELKIEEWKARQTETNWGIEGARLLSVAQDGTYAIVERLYHPFDSWEWKSSDFKIDPQEEPRALILANHIYHMLQQKGTPENLSAKDLMFDAEGNLKTTRLLKYSEFNYNRLETFCFDVSKGNYRIAKFLMTVSRLRAHPIAIEYYAPLVSYAFQTGSTQLLTASLPHGFDEQAIREHAEKLCEEAMKLREETFEEVKDLFIDEERYQLDEEEELKLAVGEELAAIYTELAMHGKLWPHLKQEVVQRFKNGVYGRKKSMQEMTLTKDYYESFFNKMNRYNESVAKVAIS